MNDEGKSTVGTARSIGADLQAEAELKKEMALQAIQEEYD